MVHVPMTRAELVGRLTEMRDAVDAGRSASGAVEYLPGLDGAFKVRATWLDTTLTGDVVIGEPETSFSG